VLPEGLAVSLDLDRVAVLPVFKWLASAGQIGEREMLRTFNCGIGMIAVCDAAGAEAAGACFAANGETVARLGEVVAADGGDRVRYRGRLDLSR
jgi:phosphoribosylformylglycinamidine cyclo-ligase